MPIDEHPVRTKRKDAAQNTERLVQAAREVFARQGLSATLEDIAQHAGVGVGTVYRNFSSKREIIETLYAQSMESVLVGVRSAVAIQDPWLALESFFESTAAAQARDRGLCELFLGRAGFEIDPGVSEELMSALTRLFDRASAAGVIRAGISVSDTRPIFAMLYSIYGMDDAQPDLWRRYLALLLDGLRADGRPALPEPAMDVASFTTALRTAT